MTRLFILHLIIAAMWVAYTGSLTIEHAVLGFGIGYALMTAYSLATKGRYHLRLLHSIWLFFYFHYELVTSSIGVLWDIITPGQKNTPGFIAMPLDAQTPLEIFFTANLISLTPGTLSIALSEDYATLYIHAMFVDDVSSTVDSLKNFESVILRAFR